MANFLKRAGSWGMVVFGVVMGCWLFWEFAKDSPSYGRVRIASVLSLGAVLLTASITATLNRRLAGYIFMTAAPLICILIVETGHLESAGFMEAIAGAFVISGVLLFAPGLFWLLTSRRKWQSLISPSHMPREPWLRAGLVTVLFFGIVFFSSFASALLSFWDGPNRCQSISWAQKRSMPGTATFTAHLSFLGLPRNSDGHANWAVFHVEERFWGLPLWAPNYIALRGYFSPSESGRRFLVDARHLDGVLTRFLPVFEPFPCGCTTGLEFAEMDLRILHSEAPKNGVRVIGRVLKSKSYEPMVGIRVLIAGPSGSLMTVTDPKGIYDISSLPPGHYYVRLAEDAFLEGDRIGAGYDLNELKQGDIGEYTLFSK